MKEKKKTVKLKKNKTYLVGTDGSIWELKGKVDLEVEGEVPTQPKG